MPHLPDGNGSKRRSCPDSAALSAFMENQLSGADRDAVAAHLAQCSECARLHDRLVNFSKATAEQDPEWENAEKRLAIWMSGFLDAHYRGGDGIRASRPDDQASTDKPDWRRSWKLQWALSTLTAVALLAGAAFLLRPVLTGRGGEKQTASQPLVSPPQHTEPPTQTATAAAPPKPVGERTAGQSRPSGTAPVPADRHGSNESVPRDLPQVSLSKPPEQVPPSSTTPTETAAPSVVGQTQTPPTSPANVTRPAPTSFAHASNPSPPAGKSGAGPETKSPAMELAREPLPGAQSPAGKPDGSIASASGAASMSATPNPPPSRTNTAIPRTAPPPPSAFRIPTDTRLWIRLSAVNHQPDGSFTFRGSLLQPVSDANGVSIERGAEVIGFGKVNQGKTFLLVGDFIVGQNHYKLKGAAGPADARGPGAGPTVDFEAGKVLEMFVTAASFYEKLPAADGQYHVPNE
jgi:Putative zinc-finger